MAMVEVTREELARFVGVSPDVDDATLQRAIDSKLAQIEAEKHSQTMVSAAEQRARAEDWRIVIAAHNEGRITQGRISFWCDALKRDREGNRAVLASLAPGLPPAEKLPTDPELEQVQSKVLGRLGVKSAPGANSAPRTVAAASSTSPPSSAPVDMLGLPLPGVPSPVRIVRGKPPEQWTAQERSDWFMHQLGGRFRQGVKPAPGGEGWYLPSPNDPYEWVETGGGRGEFRAKPDYQPRGD